MWFWILLIAIAISLAIIFWPRQKEHFTGTTASNTAYNLPFIVHDLLSPEDRAYIMRTAEPKLQDSNTLGGRNAAIRNSQQAWLYHSDPVVKKLLTKLHDEYALDPAQAESLQVVRYRPGEYYHEHHDSCCDDKDVCKTFLAKSGHRILTVLIYLNDEFEGGATRFANLDLQVKPKPGDAVVFFPLARDEARCHPLALHAGMPVTAGEKWVCNLWYRQYPVVHG